MLPTGTYIKGFMRSYAEFLGLDGQLYVDEYNSRHIVEGFDDMPQRRPRIHQTRSIERKVVFIALAGIAAVTALVIVAWKFGGGSAPSTARLPSSSRTRRRSPVSGSSGSARAHIWRSAAGRHRKVSLPGHAPSRRQEVPDRQAFLDGGQAPRRCAVQARRQAGVLSRPAATSRSSSRRRRRLASPGSKQAARGHRRHGQRARARRANRSQRAVPRTGGVTPRPRARADRHRRRRGGGARDGSARSARRG